MEPTSNLRIFGYENEAVNGTNIKDQGFDLNYNGDYADLSVFTNGTTNYQRLTKADILNIMGIQSSPITLEERLTELSESKTPFHRTPTPYPYQRENPRIQYVDQPQIQYQSLRTNRTNRTKRNTRIGTSKTRKSIRNASQLTHNRKNINKSKSKTKTKTKSRIERSITRKSNTKTKSSREEVPSIENVIY